MQFMIYNRCRTLTDENISEAKLKQRKKKFRSKINGIKPSSGKSRNKNFKKSRTVRKSKLLTQPQKKALQNGWLSCFPQNMAFNWWSQNVGTDVARFSEASSESYQNHDYLARKSWLPLSWIVQNVSIHNYATTKSGTPFRSSWMMLFSLFFTSLIYTNTRFSCLIYAGKAAKCTFQSLSGLSMSTLKTELFTSKLSRKSSTDDTYFHSFSDQSFKSLICWFIVAFCYCTFV